MNTKLRSIIESHNNDKYQLIDILNTVQDEFGYISDEAIEIIAGQLKISKVDVEQTLTFYHFLSTQPRGKYNVYLNNSVTSSMAGCKEIATAFEKETGIKFGNVTSDGLIGLYYTSCIGMCDQEPAALINNIVYTNLTPEKVYDIVKFMKEGKDIKTFIKETGDGNNSHPLINSMVSNNIRKKGAVLFGDYTSGISLKKVTDLAPEKIIDEVKTSNLRGRGGAGFSTGLKWEFCSKAEGTERYVICNADEGEPGTFKDRVLLTERASQIFEGMAICAYAIGAQKGVIYIRAEYKYLKTYLESILSDMRTNNLLGTNICGKQGFNFDINIQYGAGAYVCGEESALIESAEGKRGEPRNRPPFPVSKGLYNKPSTVNNVETFAAIPKIIEKGAEWYKSMGTQSSSGTKVISVSGDCKNPGIYEIEWGMSVYEMLKMVGAENTMAVQVAGPSGVCLAPDNFERKIAFEDLATGGSMIIIGSHRDLLKDIVLNFMEFFVEESCGSCVPCRALNKILKDKLENIITGNATLNELTEIEKLCSALSKSTRCGLGQTSSNPILSTIKNFREKYTGLLKDTDYVSTFNIEESVKKSCNYVKRVPNLH